jgi:hypothetical protein
MLWPRPLIRIGCWAMPMACFVLATAIWDAAIAALSLELSAAPETTVSTTLVELYETTKCSVPLMAIVELENVPVMLAAFRTVKVCPTEGVKALTRAAVSVPPKLAAPVI